MVRQNEVRIENSAGVQGSVYGGYSTRGDVLENEVFLDRSHSLHLQGWVYGGLSGSGNVRGNIVHLQGSAGEAKGFFGGFSSNGGEVVGNQVRAYAYDQAISGKGLDEMYGGASAGNGWVENNSVVVEAGSRITSAYGGYSMGENTYNHVLGNTVSINSSQARWLYGGYSEGPSRVEGNAVLFSNSGAEEVYGGYAASYGYGDAADVINNTVDVWLGYNSHADGRYVGGYSGADSSVAASLVQGNTVNIHGDAFGYFYGGYGKTALIQGNAVRFRGDNSSSEAGGKAWLYGGYSNNEGKVRENTVDISSSTFSGTVYGGYTGDAGTAVANLVSLNSSRVTGNIYGGYGKYFGTAVANKVSVDSSHITGNVHGGSSERADATGNEVFLNSSTVEGVVYGGHAMSGKSTGNSVHVTGEGSYSTIYGGFNGGSPGPRGPSPIYDLDCFTGNTLYKESEAAAIGSVAAFERIVFGYSGSANIANLDVSSYILDTAEYISGNYPRVILDTGNNDIDLTGTHIYSQDGFATMIKEGAGSLTASLQWGHVHVREGTWRNDLDRFSGGWPVEMSLHVYNGAGLEFRNQRDVVYAGLITGPGSLSKTGAGTLTLTHESVLFDNFPEWEDWEYPHFLTDDHTFSGSIAAHQGNLWIADGSTLLGDGSRASSVFVSPSTALTLGRSAESPRPLATGAATFSTGSALFLDYAGAGHLGQIRAGSARIEPGARFGLLNTATITVGQTVSGDFLAADTPITGEFTPIFNPQLLNLAVAKSSNDRNYTFTATRVDSLQNILGNRVHRNTLSLASGLDTLYGNANPKAGTLRGILSHFDTLTTRGEMVSYAQDIAHHLTPQTITQSLNALQDYNAAVFDVMRDVFANNGSGTASASAFSRSDDADSLERVLYAVPLGQWTHFSAPSRLHTSYNDFTGGIGIGAGLRRENNFSIDAGAYYLRSDLDSSIASIDTDIFGLNVYGRKYLTSTGPLWFAEGGLGYAYGDIEQVRETPWGNNDSDTHSRLFSVKANAGVDIPAGNHTVVTPAVGLDYNNIDVASYSERGTGTRLKVDPDKYESLQGVIDLRVKSNLTDALFVSGHAAYRHEFADRAATTRNAFAVAPDTRFVTKGFKQARSQGEFGLGLGWQPSDNISLGLNYDLRLKERQHSHSAMATIKIAF